MGFLRTYRQRVLKLESDVRQVPPLRISSYKSSVRLFQKVPFVPVPVADSGLNFGITGAVPPPYRNHGVQVIDDRVWQATSRH